MRNLRIIRTGDSANMIMQKNAISNLPVPSLFYKKMEGKFNKSLTISIMTAQLEKDGSGMNDKGKKFIKCKGGGQTVRLT